MIVLIGVAVAVGLALLWREAHEMERGEGPPALTRQRTLGAWVLLILRFLFPGG